MNPQKKSQESQTLSSRYFGEASQPDAYSVEEAERLLDAYTYRVTLKRFIYALPQNARVLDAGCGKGKIARLIRGLRPDVEVVAIDITDMRSMLPPDISFEQITTDDIDTHFPNEHFDAVVCLHVLEHLLYPMKTMSAFRHVLKKQGSIYIELPNWTRMLMPFSKKFFWNDYSHVRLFTKHTLTLLAKDYDLTIETLETKYSERSLHGMLASMLLPDILIAVVTKR